MTLLHVGLVAVDVPRHRRRVRVGTVSSTRVDSRENASAMRLKQSVPSEEPNGVYRGRPLAASAKIRTVAFHWVRSSCGT